MQRYLKVEKQTYAFYTYCMYVWMNISPFGIQNQHAKAEAVRNLKCIYLWKFKIIQ